MTATLRVHAHEPQWMEHFEDALAAAAELRRAVVVKPAGQGITADDNW